MIDVAHPSVIEDLSDPRRGFALVSVGIDSLDAIATRLDAILSDAFRHISVFPAFPAWKPIGVNPALEDFRVGGVGFIPLHIDFVNASNPPDLVAFYCESEDALGGGASILSSKSKTLDSLPEALVEELRALTVREGRFFALENLGVELNPFPLLDDSFLRFTGKKLREDARFAGRDLLQRVEDAAMEVAVRVTLRSGDVLLVNQRECLHGRDRLQPGADNQVPLGRSLYQRFYRMIE